MKHWAFDLVGKRYRSGACGPDAFYCWGLVRYVFATRHGIDLPVVNLDDADATASILSAVRASGWRRVYDQPAEDDVVLMDGIEGRHVGLMVRANGSLGILHAVGNDAHGQVVWQRMSELIGYKNFEYWRRTCLTN